jgi:hypothetical protein
LHKDTHIAGCCHTYSAPEHASNRGPLLPAVVQLLFFLRTLLCIICCHFLKVEVTEVEGYPQGGISLLLVTWNYSYKARDGYTVVRKFFLWPPSPLSQRLLRQYLYFCTCKARMFVPVLQDFCTLKRCAVVDSHSRAGAQRAAPCFTSACQSASAYVRIRQHTSAYVSRARSQRAAPCFTSACQSASAYVRIRQHTSAYVSRARSQRAAPCFTSEYQSASAYVRMHQHTSAELGRREPLLVLLLHTSMP